MTDVAREAQRIVGNMARVALYNGTTTPEVVDEICQHYSVEMIYCNGEGRKMIFTPITQNTIAFKTVPF